MARKPKDTTTKTADPGVAPKAAIKTKAQAIADLPKTTPAINAGSDVAADYEARPQQETPADDDDPAVWNVSLATAEENAALFGPGDDDDDPPVNFDRYVAGSAGPTTKPEPGILEIRLHDEGDRAANPFESLYDETDPDDDPAGVLTFTGYRNLGELPAIPADAKDPGRIGALADVFYASGYCGDLTPAQIATHIIFGGFLGLNPARAIADLTIEPGPIVRFGRDRTYEAADDAIENEYSRIRAATTPEPASPAGNAEFDVPAGGSSIRQFPNAKVIDEGERRIVELESGRKFDVTDIVDKIHGKFDEIADKAPISVPDPERPLDDSQAKSDEARPASVEAPADSGDIKARDLTDIHSGADAGAFGSAEPVGNDGAELVAGWRARIVEITNDVGGDGDGKGKTFDALSRQKQRDMFEKAVLYYADKLDETRKFVLDALAADGKTTLDAQRGFFLFAEVSADPAGWTYSEARRAADAIKEFTTPAPAAA